MSEIWKGENETGADFHFLPFSTGKTGSDNVMFLSAAECQCPVSGFEGVRGNRVEAMLSAVFMSKHRLLEGREAAGVAVLLALGPGS